MESLACRCSSAIRLLPSTLAVSRSSPASQPVGIERLLPNYGERYRYGETITTSFAESTVNEVVAKRMVKKQQMQWSPVGAHYLLQTRTSVLNGELRGHFEQRYPALRTAANDSESTLPEQMAA